ncbi:MAG: hypothetical protein MJA83_03385, partial [Gammaproteobacteria bacterium]|nr:hypothetical protein [Gammaproteobacteria bacterium]
FGGTPGNVLVAGDINARGPNADVSILGQFDQVQTRNISVSATGNEIIRSSTGTVSYGGVDFEETINGGFAAVEVEAATVITGNVGAEAPGAAFIEIGGNSVTTGSLNATAAAGQFSKLGDVAPIDNLNANDPPLLDDFDFAGPNLDQGSVNGGGAGVEIRGINGDEFAGTINVGGNITVAAQGDAEVLLSANESVTVTGNVSATGGKARILGTGTDDFLDTDSGISYAVTQSVDFNFGEARITFQADENDTTPINIGGNINAVGPGVIVEMHGGNINMQGFNATASGGTVEFAQTFTNTVDPTDTISANVSGPGAINFVIIEGAGNVGLNGAGTLNAVGAGGISIEADGEIVTQDLTLNVTEANFRSVNSDISQAVSSVSASEAILRIIEGDEENPSQATINGNVSVTSGINASVGGNAAISGDLTITATNGNIDSEISELAQGLIAVRSDDDDFVDRERVDLPNMTFSANNIAFTAGNNINISDSSLSATNAMTMTAGGTIQNAVGANLRADAMALQAQTINLSESEVVIGDGVIDGVDGDETIVRLLALNDIGPASDTPNGSFRANSVAIGSLTFGGSYLFVESNNVEFGEVNFSDPAMVAQLTPVAAGASFSLENNAGAAATVNYGNAEHVGQFAGAPVVLG